MAKRIKKRVLRKVESRTEKIDKMYKDIEAAIFLHIDDQQDAIYMASLLLTAAKNMFVRFLGSERTAEILELAREQVNS